MGQEQSKPAQYTHLLTSVNVLVINCAQAKNMK